jgi:hypothetical protein
MTEKKPKYNFYENLKELSEIKDDELVCNEWEKVKIGDKIKEYSVFPLQCICNAKIRHHYFVKNKINGNIIFAGSGCNSKFKTRKGKINPNEKKAHRNVMDRAEYGIFSAEIYKQEIAIELYNIYIRLIKKAKTLYDLDKIKEEIDNLIFLKNSKELYDELFSIIEDIYEQEELKPYLDRLDIDIDTFSNMSSSKNKKEKEKSDYANYSHIEKIYYDKLIYCDNEKRDKLVNEIKERYIFFTKKYYQKIDELIDETDEIRSSNMKERWNV